MKKILYSVFLTALLLPLAVSCNKEYNSEESFQDPRFAQYACKLTPKADGESIVSIELTESGLYILEKAVPGSSGKTSFSYGTYNVNGGVYSLNGFGTLAFDNSASGDVQLTITSAGGAAPQTVQATLSKAAGNNQFYRTWEVEKTRVTVRGWTTASADFTGCNFYEIAEFLRRNNHKAPADVDPGYGLKNVVFTGNNSAIFVYTDETLDRSEFSLDGESLSYSWENDTLGFTFITDKAKVEYMDGKCLLRVDAQIQNSTTSGSVTFVLAPVD